MDPYSWSVANTIAHSILPLSSQSKQLVSHACFQTATFSPVDPHINRSWKTHQYFNLHYVHLYPPSGHASFWSGHLLVWQRLLSIATDIEEEDKTTARLRLPVDFLNNFDHCVLFFLQLHTSLRRFWFSWREKPASNSVWWVWGHLMEAHGHVRIRNRMHRRGPFSPDSWTVW